MSGAGRTARRGIAFAVITALVSTGLLAAGTTGASAAPGDTSRATGQYLAGTLLSTDLTAIAGLGGEAATSTGTAAQTNSGTLDLGALGLHLVTIPGGLQIPLNLADAGVVGQYASAQADGSSVGASGLISAAGAIGTGITPAPGVAPGPLSLNLGGVVSSLGLPAATTNELANLGVTVGVTSATANQAAPGTPTGSYGVASTTLDFTSPTLAGLTGAINARVANIQALVNALAGPGGTIATTLNGLPLAGVLSTTATLSTSNLASTVSGLTTGTLSDPAYPGVTIDLATGHVAVDLNAITALNGRAPNTPLLTAGTITTITNDITGLVGVLTGRVTTALNTAVNGITVTAATKILGANVLTINSTIGSLLAGSTSGVALLGVGLALPGGLAAVVSLLTTPLNVLPAAIAALGPAVLAPVTDLVIPAVSPVLSAAVGITMNNQATTAGVFAETALRVTLLPGSQALTLNLANATVGANALAGPPPALSGLAPTHGPTAGGTTVTITGTNLTGSTGATFAGTPGTDYTVVNGTTATVTSPAHAASAASVVVQSPNGPSGAQQFTFDAPPPSTTGLAPNHGPQAGGTLVTITGTDLTGSTGATFGGTPGTGYTVVDDTTATVTSPPGAEGAVSVIVQSPNGASGPLPFTYDAASPVASVITGIVPDHGPVAGGTSVTITGVGLSNATGATFGGVAGASFAIVNDTTATVTSPAHAAGPVFLVVQSAAGPSGTETFTFDPLAPLAPVVDGLAPDHGPITGGTSVTITGSNLTGATGATFGATAGTGFTVVDDTTATVVAPAHAAGPVSVVVQSPAGPSGPQAYTFDAPAPPTPTLTTLVPNHGPVTGGTSIVINGSGLTGATGATFGGTAGVGFTVIDDNTAEVTSPAHAVGAVPVIVQSPDGPSAPLDFTFEAVVPAAPVADSLAPDHGPLTGGTDVTITGSGFTGATGATFGATPGVGFAVVDDTTIMVTSPPHAAGSVSVVIQSPNGPSGPQAFTFDPIATPAPTATSLDPDHGAVEGGTTVTITGTGLSGATGATFGGVAGTDFTVIDGITATVVSPPHAAGTVPVVVQSPNGPSGPLDFTYDPAIVPAPALTDASPNHGPVTGGTTVTITGAGLTGATGATFGGVAGTDFTVVDDTTATVVSPSHAAGSAPIVVQSPNGPSAPLAFTFDPLALPAAPVVSSIVPNHGPAAGGTNVTITGTGLTGSTGATFDGLAGTNFVLVNDTTATVTSPAHAVGGVPLIVLSVNGASNATTFTFDPVDPTAPVITQMVPNHGPVTGGTLVTLIGNNMTAATGAMFGTTAGMSWTVMDDATATVVSPAHVRGPVSFVVMAGTAASGPQSFTFDPVTDIAGVTPDTGSQAGGTTVRITGVCFTGATAVRFGAASARSFTVLNDGAISAVTPSGTGTVSVTVVGSASCGTDTMAAAFTYSRLGLSRLPTTGVDAMWDFIAALLFLLIGGAVLFAIRRTHPRNQSDHHVK